MGPLRHIRRRPRAPGSVVRLAVARYVILSFATLLILGAATALMSRGIAREEAIRDARSRSEAIARSIAAPIVNAAVRSRDPDALGELDTAMRNRIKYGSVSHIVLWDAEGRVLWAEDPTVVGEQFGLSPNLRALAGRGGTVIAQPGERESHPGRYDTQEELLEIYVGATDADGVPFLFEAYVRPDRIDEDYQAILVGLLPMNLVMLLLLQLATLPLALSLARQIDRVNAHRSGILRRSLASWHEERRALAQELHDEVIQDLAAVSYALPAVIDQLPEGGQADRARVTALRMNDVLIKNLTSLRSMILDLAPAQLEGRGVVSALESLRDQSVALGLDVTLTVDPDVDVGESAGGLVYRVAREGMRNVAKHAGATAVVLAVARHGDQVEVLVSDDGRGLSSRPAQKGHVGLHLLGQLVESVGGTFSMSNGPQGGASLRVVVPARLPDLDERL